MMANEKGDALLAEWKERLCLTEWRIKLVDNCKPEDMMLEGCAGCTDWSEAIKTARIEILDPEFYGDRIVPFDYEKTLVHELLHLKTCLVSDKVCDLQARYMHQMIDDLARAFIDAKRAKPPKEDSCVSCTDIDHTGKPTNWEAQTRADRIRAMTDEELAEFLEKVGGCGPSFDKEYCSNLNGCPSGINCWLDWLRQEVKDAT